MSYQQAEVDWYRKHGRFPAQRIAKDGSGKPYVIGDWSWNRQGRPREEIESEMDYRLRLAGVGKKAGT